MYVDVFCDDRRCMNKIVYVEDEPEVGQLIAAYLGKHDMEVVVEPRGDRAEDVVTRENPDLVLLDIMLPGKDGMTLCRDLRTKWDGPIVLLTSLDSDMNHILSLEMGANDYILKTTPPAVLLARLRLHLRQRASGAGVKRLPLFNAAQSDALRHAFYRPGQPTGYAFRGADCALNRRF